VVKGVDDAKALGVTTEHLARRLDMPTMVKLMDAAIASKPDGLVVSIPAPMLSDPVKNAVVSGILVIVRSRRFELSRSLGALLYGADEYDAGSLPGKLPPPSASSGGLRQPRSNNISLDDRCRGFRRSGASAGAAG
jgi:simple sugar transport system substrate-binding protein